MSKNCHDDGESFHVFKRGENVCKCGIKMRTVPTMLTPTPPTGIAKASDAGRSSVQRAEGRLNEGAEPMSDEELAVIRAEATKYVHGTPFDRLLATIDALRAENERLKGSRDEWAQRSKASSKARNDADDLSRRAVSRAEAAEKHCVELEGRKAEIAALSANRVRTAEAERDAARAERDEWKLKAETLKTLNQIRFKGKDGQGLTAENWDALVSENQQALAQNAALREIAKDMHWMARRYVHDRQSYAVGLFNQHVRDLLKLGLELNATGDGTIWARDAQFGWPPEAEDPQASTRAGEEGGGDDS
jgi:hypothetical protein